jgi:hypothetical protein
MQVFISQVTGFMNGPGGQVRMWCNSCGTLGSDWNSSVVAPFTVQLNDQGHEAPEVAPWRLNLISTYTFDRGPIKGWFVGGALRVEAARILGYKYDPTFKNVNSNDPNYANVQGGHAGRTERQRALLRFQRHAPRRMAWLFAEAVQQVNWRIQLNMQNVGEKDHLVAAGYEPDGSLALARIEEGMGWRLENSLDF